MRERPEKGEYNLLFRLRSVQPTNPKCYCTHTIYDIDKRALDNSSYFPLLATHCRRRPSLSSSLLLLMFLSILFRFGCYCFWFWSLFFPFLIWSFVIVLSIDITAMSYSVSNSYQMCILLLFLQYLSQSMCRQYDYDWLWWKFIHMIFKSIGFLYNFTIRWMLR